MTELQDSYDLDFCEPYYYHFYDYYPSYYRSSDADYGTGSYEPYDSNYLLGYRAIRYEPCDPSTPSKFHGSVREPLLAKRGAGSYGQRDCSYVSGASYSNPRGYSNTSGSGTGFLDLYDYASHPYSGSIHDLCGFDPIPVGRSGYVFRRRYSCRPVTGDPRWYGSKTYYPPSYWMEQNRYYGPC